MMSLLPLIYTKDQGNEFAEDLTDVYELGSNLTSNPHEEYGQEEENVYVNTMPMCINASQVAYDRIESVSFWIEGVFQFIVGVFGIVANLLVITILGKARLRSIFNSLLGCLLVLHTIYISHTLIMYIGRAVIMSTSGGWFTVLFSYLLYPVRPMILNSTAFITVLMARQRFFAIRHPMEYRNSNLRINPWRAATKSLLLVLITSTIFVCPLFFETSVEHYSVVKINKYNKTHFQYVRDDVILYVV